MRQDKYVWVNGKPVTRFRALVMLAGAVLVALTMLVLAVATYAVI